MGVDALDVRDAGSVDNRDVQDVGRSAKHNQNIASVLVIVNDGFLREADRFFVEEQAEDADYCLTNFIVSCGAYVCHTTTGQTVEYWVVGGVELGGEFVQDFSTARTLQLVVQGKWISFGGQ